MLFIDRMIVDEKPRKTADGYLLAMPRVARTGIQKYLGDELGRPDLEEVSVYRPESEVFSKETLNSFAARPVTIDHPPVLVDSKNWKKYARGHTGEDVLRDGEFMKLSMMLTDNDAIHDVEEGKVEISLGYTADIVFESGTTPTGEHYDAIQKNIRGNHLAIVDAARGGSKLRVIDTNQPSEELPMTLKKVLVDGISVEMTETASEVVTKRINALDADISAKEKRVKELEDELEQLKKDMKSATETKDAEIATLKKELGDSRMTPEKLDEAVRARAAVVDSAKKVLSSVVVDGKTEAEIRRQVVDSKLGDVAKEWSDEQVAASFNTLTAGVVDSVRSTVISQANPQSVNDAHQKQKQTLADAWKTKTA